MRRRARCPRRPATEAYARLGQRSRKLYHKLAPVIREESGVDIEFAQCGELILAFDEEDVIGLQGLTHQFTALGEEAVWMSSDDLFQMEPGLNPAIPGAMFTPDVCRVNNQRLSGALAGGAAHHGATIRQGVEVVGLAFNDGRVTGVRTTSGTVSAGCVVLAAGAWTGMMDRWLYGDESPSVERQPMVMPVKGVNLNLQPQERKGKHHHSRLMGTSGAPERWVDDSRGHCRRGGFRLPRDRRRYTRDTRNRRRSHAVARGRRPELGGRRTQATLGGRHALAGQGCPVTTTF